MWFKARRVMSVALFMVAATAAGCAKGQGPQGSTIDDRPNSLEEGTDEAELAGETSLTDTLLPGDAPRLSYLILDVSAVELRPATRGRPAREVPLRIESRRNFPTVIELGHLNSWKVRSENNFEPAVSLWVSGTHSSEYSSGFQIRGLVPTDDSPLELTSRGYGYMTCADWGVTHSDSDTFRSDIEGDVPDSAKIVLSENGDMAVVSFECQVRNRTRRYTLTYALHEEVQGLE